jgi:hypothetical protein
MELRIAAGDEIRYTTAIGRRLALVKRIIIAPAPISNDSIVWLDLKVYGINCREFDRHVSLPADAASLKAFKVELV